MCANMWIKKIIVERMMGMSMMVADAKNMFDLLSNKNVKTSVTSITSLVDSMRQDFSIPNSSIVDIFKFGIKPNEWAFYCLVESYNQNGMQVPNAIELAEVMGITKRAIYIIIKDMSDRGLLTIGGTRTNRVYDFTTVKKIMNIQ